MFLFGFGYLVCLLVCVFGLGVFGCVGRLLLLRLICVLTCLWFLVICLLAGMFVLFCLDVSGLLLAWVG